MDEVALGIPPLGKVSAWGNPFHGTIVSSTLTLPNDETLTIPAATHNDCFIFRVPGAPGGGSAAVPAGGEWRDYLLLYGNCSAVYGKTISSNIVNWLYAHPDGSRWLITMNGGTGIAFSNASLNLTFFAKRFGEIGAAAESIEFTLTLASRGLGEATPLVDESLPASAMIGISDVTESGDKCCLMFWATKTGTEVEGQRFPYGFFEVVLSSTDFTASTATLVYDIADVAGARQEAFYDYTSPTFPPPPFCGSETASNTASAAAEYVDGAIVACWYDDTDVLKAITFTYNQPLVSSTPDIYSMSASCEYNYATEKTNNSEWSIVCGATGIGTYTITATADYYLKGLNTTPGDISLAWREESLDMLVAAGADTLFSMSYFSYTDGAEPGNTDGALNERFDSWVTGVLPDFTVYTSLQVNLSRMHPWALYSAPRVADHDIAPFIPEANDAPQLFAKRFSSTLIGFGRTWINRTTLERETRIDKFLTKSGLVANSYSVPVDIELRQLSATVHPVTFDVEIAPDGTARSFV